MNPPSNAYITGFSIGMSLILAIGAQNAFVLKQGLRREHVFLVCLVCAFSDAVLVTLGVSGFGAVSARLAWVAPAMRYAGALFLLWYGAKSFLAAWRGGAALDPAEAPEAGRTRILLTTLALTWLNPHVYIDTMLLLGSISTQFPGQGAPFALGAVSASFLFFFALGYGARLLRPVFARPAAWRVLDGLIGVTMWSIAVRLIV